MKNRAATVIRLAMADDAPAIAEIYSPIVRDTHLSAEFVVPDANEMAQRVAETNMTHPWLVAEVDGVIAGYAYATKFRSRPAYQWSAEVSVYVRPDCMRIGYARGLYTSLLACLRLQGFHQAIAVIALPNPASVALHEGLGYRPIGVFADICHKHERWYDIGWWGMTIRETSTLPLRVATPQELLHLPAWRDALRSGIGHIKARP